MKRSVPLLALATGALLLGATSTFADPPLPPKAMPGEVVGRVRTRWLAPHVSATSRSVGGAWTMTVQWFGPRGALLRERSGPTVDAHPGYVSEPGKGGLTIHGVNAPWKLLLPRPATGYGYITATEDSRTFVHQHHPKKDEIAVDVYVNGKRAATVGPFLQYEGRSVHLGEDGSLALLIWKDEDRKVAQVVVAGPDGKVRSRNDCDGPVTGPIPAPAGLGALVRANEGDPSNPYTFHAAGRKVSALKVGPNAGFAAWLPGTTTALFHTSIGHEYRFHLIDWSTGKRLWDVVDPNPVRVSGEAPAIAWAGDYLLVGGLEWAKRIERPVRSIQALDVKKGTVVARWLPAPLRAFAQQGRFLRLGNRLYLIDDEEFALLDPNDITARRNGWR